MDSLTHTHKYQSAEVVELTHIHTHTLVTWKHTA